MIRALEEARGINPPLPSGGRRLEIRELKQGEGGEWDRVVRSSPSGTFFHLSGWRDVIERVLRRRCFSLVARADNAICGVFPLAWIRSRIFGDCLVSLPLAVYGGICADDRDTYFS